MEVPSPKPPRSHSKNARTLNVGGDFDPLQHQINRAQNLRNLEIVAGPTNVSHHKTESDVQAFRPGPLVSRESVGWLQHEEAAFAWRGKRNVLIVAPFDRNNNLRSQKGIDYVLQAIGDDVNNDKPTLGKCIYNLVFVFDYSWRACLPSLKIDVGVPSFLRKMRFDLTSQMIVTFPLQAIL